MKTFAKRTLIVLSTVMAFSTQAQLSPLTDHEVTRDPLFENGFLELPDNMMVKADHQHKVVRYFIDFSCIYCRSLTNVMDTWGNTLSQGYTLVYHHVGHVQSARYFIQSASLTYVMNSDISYGQKQEFIELMFANISKVSTNKELIRLVKEATAKVGVDPREVARYIMSEESTETYKQAVKLQNDININLTPSLLVAGKYLTHLGMTDGSPERWIELINKVTSIDFYSRTNTLTEIPNPTLQGLPTKD